MLSSKTLSAGSKPHFMLLDGLRGVAALMVMCYHIFEAFATSPFDQGFNHGYLAVDFFFVLSGFVVGYAYDDRRDTMSACQFPASPSDSSSSDDCDWRCFRTDCLYSSGVREVGRVCSVGFIYPLVVFLRFAFDTGRSRRIL